MVQKNGEIYIILITVYTLYNVQLIHWTPRVSKLKRFIDTTGHI